MKSIRYLKTKKEKPEEEIFDLFELILDPVRSKIIFEIILKGEATAEMLVEATKKSRSTISHHLKKLVDYRILDVFMNPTGKTKFYRITENLSDLVFTFDEEEFSKGSLEEKSTHIMNLYQLYAMMNHIYSNIFSDQIKLFQKYLPFDDVNVKNRDIDFKIKDKEIEMPYFSSIIIGEKQATFLRTKLKEMMIEFNNEFSDLTENLKITDFKTKYLVKLLVFPFYDENDLVK